MCLTAQNRFGHEFRAIRVDPGQSPIHGHKPRPRMGSRLGRCADRAACEAAGAREASVTPLIGGRARGRHSGPAARRGSHYATGTTCLVSATHWSSGHGRSGYVHKRAPLRVPRPGLVRDPVPVDVGAEFLARNQTICHPLDVGTLSGRHGTIPTDPAGKVGPVRADLVAKPCAPARLLGNEKW